MPATKQLTITEQFIKNSTKISLKTRTINVALCIRAFVTRVLFYFFLFHVIILIVNNINNRAVVEYSFGQTIIKETTMKKKIIVLFLLLVFFLTAGLGCKNPGGEAKKKMQPITLKYWRVYDEEDAFDKIIKKYKSLHSFVTIEYKKFRFDEYEKELLNALAEDRGPDIFSIPSTWIAEYQNKIQPMPAQTTMVYPVIKGTLKKELIPELRTVKSLTLRELKNNFVDIVYDDVLLKKDGEEKVYGLPLYMDTLAMYYNRDLLNNAGITKAPENWNKKFQETVKKLTKQNNKGLLIQSGVGMGGAENIERSADILALLMMQNGAVMSQGNSILFHEIPPGNDRDYNPGLGALQFYTDFANPAKEVYCWNNNLSSSIDLFTQGNLAMMFGYSYHLPTIKARAPKLNFGIAKIPQIEGSGNQTKNFANYWVETVSAKSKHIDEAWDFVQFATRKEQAKTYLEKTKKPTALKSLVNEQIDDLEIGSFAEQVLTAKSWYHGKNAKAAEEAIDEMIELTVQGDLEIESIISQGAKKVQQTLK